eukprot:TRINITY_DN3422_c0_g1_i1.p1 TRINITY_DN3422_c0_g1~~TRINITY_DN3422_c0_g1_i1.p1  ORF type:complete len:1330 (-),score=396.77 TRINITY_DN3422_c0_g1_i1:200-4189(-)
MGDSKKRPLGNQVSEQLRKKIKQNIDYLKDDDEYDELDPQALEKINQNRLAALERRKNAQQSQPVKAPASQLSQAPRPPAAQPSQAFKALLANKTPSPDPATGKATQRVQIASVSPPVAPKSKPIEQYFKNAVPKTPAACSFFNKKITTPPKGDQEEGKQRPGVGLSPSKVPLDIDFSDDEIEETEGLDFKAKSIPSILEKMESVEKKSGLKKESEILGGPGKVTLGSKGGPNKIVAVKDTKSKEQEIKKSGLNVKEESKVTKTKSLKEEVQESDNENESMNIDQQEITTNTKSEKTPKATTLTLKTADKTTKTTDKTTKTTDKTTKTTDKTIKTTDKTLKTTDKTLKTTDKTPKTTDKAPKLAKSSKELEEEAAWKKLSSKQKLTALHYENRHSLPAIPLNTTNKLLQVSEDQDGTNPTQAQSKRPDWLVNVRDAKGRSPGSPGYDPTTLYIPDNANLTPAKKQYYEWKKKMFDQIIFFQQGDFYNIFGHDADVGVELGLVYNPKLDSVGVNRRQVDFWKAKFLNKGYKVCIISQQDTAVTDTEKEKKKKSKTPQKKTEDREITEILTVGTVRDFEIVDTDLNARYLMSINETQTPKGRDFGICFVDSTTGEFCVSHFEDDDKLSYLETLLIRIQPKEMLLPESVSKDVMKRINQLVSSPFITRRTFPDYDSSLYSIAHHFSSKITDDKLDIQNWPEALQKVSEVESLICSIAAVVCYFEELHFANDFVKIANFQVYDVRNQGNCLVLDSVSLLNLEILQNNDNFGGEGTLLSVLDHCKTAFGKRLLRRWLCHPLKSVRQINQRLTAVEFMKEHPEIRDRLKEGLMQLIDIERYLTRARSKKISVKQFVECLDSYEKGIEMVNSVKKLLNEHKATDDKTLGLLYYLIFEFPNLSEFFESFDFDRETAKTTGTINPTPGTVPDYDTAQENLNNVLASLENTLQKFREKTDISDIVYHQSKTERYTLKIKKNSEKGKKIPKNWTKVGNTQQVSRYKCPEVEELVSQLDEATEELTAVSKNLLFMYLNSIEPYYANLTKALDYFATLDVIYSFTIFASEQDYEVCRPQFVRSAVPIFKATSIRHPYAANRGPSFIPNNISIGGDRAPLWLITGPNMGGKSTLLRQAAIVVIMAQIGCLVPAETCILSPVDQIFTRLGARDRIFAGQSTFMLELDETSKILNSATQHSFVILDELGRGTSTFDGFAIAYAVVQKLEVIGSRVLFATHYHKLVDEFANSAKVGCAHMGCATDGGRMVFTYLLEPGACPRSYGMNVAAMANLPEEVIKRAAQKSEQFESLMQSKAERKDLLDILQGSTLISRDIWLRANKHRNL